MKSKEATISAREFWKHHFGEYPQNDKEKLAVGMMQEYAHLFKADESPIKEDGEDGLWAIVHAEAWPLKSAGAFIEKMKSLGFRITKKSNQ